MNLTNIAGNVTFQAADANGNSFDMTIAGALTGAGGFKKTGGGTLTLAGTNTFSGSTEIDGGTVLVKGGGSASRNQWSQNNQQRDACLVERRERQSRQPAWRFRRHHHEWRGF